jgi:hypothetical protein
VNTVQGAAAIPWAHEASEFGSVWRWDTPHFVVTVNGDARSCYFQIADKVADPYGPPKPLTDGQSRTFEEAEKLIRGAIGKAYPPALGYGLYAGPWGTTFTIGTGEQVDLGVYANREVTVTVMNPDGTDTDYTGTGRVEHYHFILTLGAQSLRISPSYIGRIRLAGSLSPLTITPTGNRTVRGTIEPGCTGRPGFISGTVEHTGLTCSIHEERLTSRR